MDFDIYNYLLFWTLIVGVCLGSFYNVVILRSLSNESIAFPASKCPKCNHKLYFWHNIPVLSYILLGGKCYFCKEKISIQYPIIELLTMILFGASFIKFGITYSTLMAFIIISALIIMSMTDIKEKLVDCNIAIGLGVIGILYNWLVTNSPLDSFYGLFAGIVILETIARIGYLFTKGRAMGEADTYVAGALGACFGLSGVLHILLYSVIAAGIIAVPQYLYRRFIANDKLTVIVFMIFLALVGIHMTVFQNYILLSLIIITSIILCLSIKNSIKTPDKQSYLPFVPALTIGTIYYMFVII